MQRNLDINKDVMKVLILDLLNDFCAHLHTGSVKLADAARKEDHNGKWLLDSLVTYQAASILATMFSIPKDVEPFILFEKTSLDSWANIVCEHVKNESPDIVFFTSGTTGKRKAIAHSLESLIDEAQDWISLMGDIEHIFINVPRHHIYGFIWGLIIPSLAKCEVIDYRACLINTNKLSKNALIVSTPHASALLTSNPELGNTGASVVLSTSPCDHKLLTDLKMEGYKNAYHVYGSTETGGIGYRTQDSLRFSLCANISEKLGVLYRNANELPVQDKLEFFEDSTFSVISRFDKAIQIRGYNVNMDALEAFILQQAFVNDVGLRISGEEEQKYLEVLVQATHISKANAVVEEIMRQYGNIIHTNNIRIVDGSIRNSLGKLVFGSIN